MACDPQWALVRFPDELYDHQNINSTTVSRFEATETDNIRINLDPSSVSLSDFAGFFRGRIIPRLSASQMEVRPLRVTRLNSVLPRGPMKKASTPAT